MIALFGFVGAAAAAAITLSGVSRERETDASGHRSARVARAIAYAVAAVGFFVMLVSLEAGAVVFFVFAALMVVNMVVALRGARSTGARRGRT